MKTIFSVRIIEMSHYQDPDGEHDYEGFPSQELAKEFARRWVRDSVEELRVSGQCKDELRKLWWIFGDDALTLDYKGSDELDFFINNPATREECDWNAILEQAGIKQSGC